MRVLWLTSIVLPAQGKKLGVNAAYSGGWVSGLLDIVVKSREKLEIILCTTSHLVKGIQLFEENSISYSLVGSGMGLENNFSKLLEITEPDIIHIFGTEHVHSSAMQKVAGNRPGCRVLLQMQGFAGACAPVYFSGMPERFSRPNPIKQLAGRLAGGGNLYTEHKAFLSAVRPERASLELCTDILGHTEWDEAIAHQYAPQAWYRRVGEVLRPAFYSASRWRIDSCSRFHLFAAQANYPLKGGHILLRAFKGIVEDWPNTHLFIAGAIPKRHNNFLFRTITRLAYEYHQYLLQLTRELGIADRVTFLGMLSENEMLKQYQQAHVFVSSSAMENTANALREAMLVGTPSVASAVGGVATFIRHGETALLYPFDEPEMLRHYVGKVFSNDNLAEYLSNAGRALIQEENDPIIVAGRIMDIYFGKEAQ